MSNNQNREQAINLTIRADVRRALDYLRDTESFSLGRLVTRVLVRQATQLGCEAMPSVESVETMEFPKAAVGPGRKGTAERVTSGYFTTSCTLPRVALAARAYLKSHPAPWSLSGAVAVEIVHQASLAGYVALPSQVPTRTVRLVRTDSEVPKGQRVHFLRKDPEKGNEAVCRANSRKTVWVSPSLGRLTCRRCMTALGVTEADVEAAAKKLAASDSPEEVSMPPVIRNLDRKLTKKS